MNLPAEAMELEAPIRIRRWHLRSGSGCEGRIRGGLGQVKEYEILDDVEESIAFSHRAECHFVAAGDRLAIESPGGGDRGDLRERSPVDCAVDLANGKMEPDDQCAE